MSMMGANSRICAESPGNHRVGKREARGDGMRI